MSPSRHSDGAGRFALTFWRRAGKALGIDLRRGEALNAGLLFVAFLFLFAFQYATKSIRQATYVDEIGAINLPWVYLLVALCSYPFLWVYQRFSDRLRLDRLVMATCIIVALSMAGFWWLLREPENWETAALYVWLAIVFGLTVSQFWFLAGRVFDPRQSRRLFGLVGAGALLGSVAGGQVASLVTAQVGTRHALLVAGLVILPAGAIVLVLSRFGPTRKRLSEALHSSKLDETRGGLQLLRDSRHLQLISLILVIGVIVSQIVDLQFNWAIEQATTGLDARTTYFGNLYSLIGLSAFVFQLLLTSRIHQSLGVTSALRVLPLTMAVGAGGLLFAAAFLPAALLRIAQGLKVGENGLRYSLEQASRELLFLPVPAALRIRAKAFIDVFVQRAAKGLAALALLPITFGLFSPVHAAWLSLGLTLIWLGLTRSVHRHYVRAFRSSLSQRRVDTRLPIKISDATTLELLVQSLGSPDPRQVLHSLEVLASHGRGNLVLPLLLHHDEAAVRRRTLEILADEGRKDAVPLIERRLADEVPEVRALAIRVLAQLSGANAVRLMVPRLEEGNPKVRAAAVAFLFNHADEADKRLAAPVLLELLADSDPEARAEAAKALSSIPDPEFGQQLLQLLYDADRRVVREAIVAVRHRLEAGSKSPIYLPTLVSLLANRRLKHDARRALVAYGEAAVPALVHFMSDPDEQIWVKRALPKAAAAIGTPLAARGLLECLESTTDTFMRRKLVESLATLDFPPDEQHTPRVIEQAMREIVCYLEALRDLASLGHTGRFRLDGPKLRWIDQQSDPSLLERLLSEALDDHLKNSFGLLALCHEPEHLWPAYLGLLGVRRATRGHALELLENTLSQGLCRDLFIMIDDLPLEERLERARQRFGIGPRSREETLRSLVEGAPECEDRKVSLAAAAIYAVYTDRVEDLYPTISAAERSAANDFVRETASWANSRLQSAAASG